MIESFRDKETKKIFQRKYSKKFPVNIQKLALRKLIMLDNAENINDLRVPPGNRLEKLSGDRKGEHSIRINDQYRICFMMDKSNIYNVEITDYHEQEGFKMIELPTISEILKEEFMDPMGISAYKLANEIKVPTSRIQDILHDRRKITPDTSIRQGRYFGVSDKYFLNLQLDIDLRKEEEKNKKIFDSIIPYEKMQVSL